MSDRPTYKDYLYHAEGRYIRSGGQYYTIVKEKSGIQNWLFFGLFIAAIGILMWLSFTNIIWPVWMGEVFVLMISFHIFVPRFHYRRARFVSVLEGTEAWQKAAALQYSPANRVTAIVLNVVLLAMFLVLYTPGGFTVSYIRSQLDGGSGIVSADFSANKMGAFYMDEHVTDERVQIPISDLSGNKVWVDITVVHTPKTARLTLDGQPVPEEYQPKKQIGLVTDWQQYFKQEAHFVVSGHLLRDGSILTLTCGHLTREWVFRLPA